MCSADVTQPRLKGLGTARPEVADRKNKTGFLQNINKPMCGKQPNRFPAIVTIRVVFWITVAMRALRETGRGDRGYCECVTDRSHLPVADSSVTHHEGSKVFPAIDTTNIQWYASE